MNTNQSNETLQHRRGFLHHAAAIPLAGSSFALIRHLADKCSPAPGVGQESREPGKEPVLCSPAARRTVLAGLAVAPAALLSKPTFAFVPELDEMVVEVATEVRRFLLEAQAADDRLADLDDAFVAAAMKELAPMPKLDQRQVQEATLADFKASLEALQGVDHAEPRPAASSLVVRAQKQALAERYEQAIAAWNTENEALAVRTGLREAEQRQASARTSASDAMDRLAAMPVLTYRGIAAKVSIFQPPLKPFDDELSDHRDFAGAILRDLGGLTERMPPSQQAEIHLDHAATCDDPLPAMWSEQRALKARTGYASDDDEEKDFRRSCELDRLATARKKATTVAGAIASLEWARAEFVQFHTDDDDTFDKGQELLLALLDGALGVLRRTAA